MNLISNSAVCNGSLIVLAPSYRSVPRQFRRVFADRERHEAILSSVQTFRGAVYLEDGAIERWQLDGERHRMPADEESWHLVSVDSSGEVCGVARIRQYGRHASFGDLGVRRSALARSEWRDKLQAAVESDMRLASLRNVRYAEVGGWAIAAERRWTTDTLKVALGMYALAELLGGSIGLATATVRHGSASILRRLGGTPFFYDGAQLPPYFDPQYRCVMEILRFDSHYPERKYAHLVNEIGLALLSVPVICAGGSQPRPVEVLPAALPYYSPSANAPVPQTAVL